MLSSDSVVQFTRTPPALFLAQVLKIVRERGEAYGPPGRHWKATSLVWTALLEAKGLSDVLDEQDVAMLFIADKLVRQFTGDKRTDDGWLDIAGYATGAAGIESESPVEKCPDCGVPVIERTTADGKTEKFWGCGMDAHDRGEV